MTICIAAICEYDDKPKIAVATDRMVTTGIRTRREYEHTETKMEPITVANEFKAVGLGAGVITLVEDFFDRLNGFLDRLHQKDQLPSPLPINLIAQYATMTYQEIIKESINNRVLSAFDMKLEDLRDEEVSLDSNLMKGIYDGINKIRSQITNNLNVIITGVAENNGASIYSFQGGDKSKHNTIGYKAIGSGQEPARLSLIHGGYDRRCEIEEAIHSLVAAKINAEEAQGVGGKMDLAVVTESGIDIFEDDEIKELVKLQKQISDKQDKVYNEELEEFGYEYERG